jgi:hypothetical protein
MWNWIHHLFNPHCPECEEKNHCKSCEVLSLQLERTQNQLNQILQSIIQPRMIEQTGPVEEIQPIRQSRYVPFSVKKQMLEAESRRQAELMRDKIKEVEESIGLKDATADKEI